MAQVIQCDICGALCEKDKAIDIQVNKVISDGYRRGDELFNRDICENCLKKVKEVLKVDK